MIHELKCWPAYFRPLANGEKTLELRRDDRGFAVGDILHLREWDPATERYTGSATYRRVTHIVRGGEWLAEGFCAMSLGAPDYDTMYQHRHAGTGPKEE